MITCTHITVRNSHKSFGNYKNIFFFIILVFLLNLEIFEVLIIITIKKTTYHCCHDITHLHSVSYMWKHTLNFIYKTRNKVLNLLGYQFWSVHVIHYTSILHCTCLILCYIVYMLKWSDIHLKWFGKSTMASYYFLPWYT